MVRSSPESVQNNYLPRGEPTALFVPFLVLDAVPDDRPRARDREEEGSMEIKRVAVDELKQMIAEGRLNVQSTAFATMGLRVLVERGLL